MTTEIFQREDGTYLNVEFVKGDTSKPGIVYLHGLQSCMNSRKGRYLKAFAEKKGLSYLSFDFSAHGLSWGKPSDFTIGRSLKDALDVLDKYVSVPQIIVGSSMGGWIGLLLCEKVPQKVAGYVGLASGTDFTQFVWDDFLNDELRDYLKKGGIIGPSEETKGYCFTYQMFQEAEQHFLLSKKVNYNGPVRLLWGTEDERVPYHIMLKTSQILTSSDCQLTLIKGGNHSLSTPEHLAIIGDTLEGILNLNENIYFAGASLEK